MSIEECSRLREVRSFSISRTRLIAALAIGVVAIAVLVVIFVVSPLRDIVRDINPDHRLEAQLHAMSVKLDSLQTDAEINDDFIDNIRTVLDVDRQPTDSASAGVLLRSLPLDSLMTGSPAERRFVASMGEREKYNLQVLSPVAADGMIFSNPVEGGIVAEESGNRFMVRMIVPLGSGVCSVADGIVVDSYNSGSSDRYTVIIQHPNGFVSRYSDVGTPLVDNGATVFAGQAITAPASSVGSPKSGATIGVELWHDGTPLYPTDYIYRMHKQ